MPVHAFSVDARPAGLVSVAASLFRHHGAVHLTTVVKATFTPALGGPMTRAAPAPIHRLDLAPHRLRADVLVTGFAYAPPGLEVSVLTARVAVLQEAPLIDKAVRVVGDRAAPLATPQPFRRMPLVHERSFGGPGLPDNPVGTGLAPGSVEPNLVDPFDPRRAVGLGPIPDTWPARAALRGGLELDAVAGALLEIPEGFDWAYFQAAPPDQQCAFLGGSEWIVLEGLHPAFRSLRTQIPGARAFGAVHGLPGERVHALALQADVLHVDTELGVVSITWRGGLPLPDGCSHDALRVACGVEAEATAPRRRLDATLKLDAGTAPVDPGPARPATLVLTPEPGWRKSTLVLTPGAPPRTSPTPFTIAEPKPASQAPVPVPGAPWSGVELTPAPPPSGDMERTIQLEWPEDDAEPIPSAAIVFVAEQPVPSEPEVASLAPSATLSPAPTAASPWAQPDPPAPEPPPPPRRPRVPKPDVAGVLYGDFAPRKKR